MNNAFVTHQTRISIRIALLCALLALAAPMALMAQQTVFYDTFGQSTLNQTNIPGSTIPGGTASDITPFSATSYTIGSAKNALNTSISSGHLQLIQGATSSGQLDCQAIFTKYPITLSSVGDYIELTYSFTDEYPILQATTSATGSLLYGLYYSGGVPPHSGTILANSGFSSSLTTADTGGTINWLGYYAETYNNTWWRLYSRIAQTTQNNLDQCLLYQSQTGASSSDGNPGSPNLVPGQPYTCQLRITLSAPGSLTISNGLYTGVDTTGPLFYTNVWTVSGANLLTTNFDALAIGYRAGSSISWTNDINYIKVVADLAAQAGPYYFVTSSGDPCSGGLTIGVSGSVITNDYWLYLNGVNTGQSVAGTGSAVDFGLQSIAGNYTVVASNTVTGSEGLMLGSASVLEPGINIVTEPSSLTLVTNVTASFSVDAVGSSLSYQWFANGMALTNGGQISGALSSNLVITLPAAANAASGTNGYYCVMQTPCGNIATSSPPAALTLIPPHHLVWAGNNNGIWDYLSDNFTLSGSPTNFVDGDDVTFDNTGNGSVSLTNSVIPTLVVVNASQAYTFNDGSGVWAGKISGFGQLEDIGSGTLTIANDNTYTGGTIVSNGATLQLGNGTGVHGSVAGYVTVDTNGTLNYNFSGPGNTTPININNGFAGDGTINFNDANGSIIATVPSIVSSNFNGTMNVLGYTCLHASDASTGYPLGNGSTINVPDNAQVWLDRSGFADNNTFNIGGNGWQGATPQTGAMRVYGCTVNGPINLTDNARIGGTISGATIQSVISGPYQLEVWGTTNSFVLIMGPTNGAPQAYASTLITAGSIQAANSNAISSGPLTLDSGGDMRVYGNNVTVASLSSINSGNIQLIEGPRVRNMNATTPGTLTVGTDGSSSEFDGTFSDGAAASFGLTKVGAGTLTLTEVSSNTGPVTVAGGKIALSGSGAFTKAQIAIASGAFFDVTGIGGTLTLNANQPLMGDGTLTGTLVAPAGSIVNPGLPMGTLTVSGSATVNGTYLANLNRTNTGNCSTITAASGVTFSGATLSVTNVGPALQAGDVFQLFPGATAGFSGTSLQANDLANKVNYTWNNTVASDGKVTVATVASRVLALQVTPTASAITYGQAISNSIISGGSVTNASGVTVAGTYAFSTPGTVPIAGTTNQTVTFTPTDTTTYNSFTFTLGVLVNQQTPLLKTVPTASTITNGNPLSLSILTGGVVTNAAGATVAGMFAWTSPSTIPSAGTSAQSVTFTPTDTTNYNSIAFSVNVTVVAPAAITALNFVGSPLVSGTNLTFSATNTGAGTFYLLGGTNVASARTTWTPLWTNVAAGSSSFTATATNAVKPVLGRQFYILSTTNNQ